MPKMTGRTAIVTGASRGIGRTIAELLAAEGARVVCVARTLKEGDHRLEGSLDSTVAAIRAAGGDAVALAADISSETECLKLVEAARAAYGPIDTLVNNAATSRPRRTRPAAGSRPSPSTSTRRSSCRRRCCRA